MGVLEVASMPSSQVSVAKSFVVLKQNMVSVVFKSPCISMCHDMSCDDWNVMSCHVCHVLNVEWCHVNVPIGKSERLHLSDT